MVKDAKMYMEDVDSFAWHGKHSKQHELVLLSLSQENPTLEPLNDYINLLLWRLDNIELSYESSCEASKRTETINLTAELTKENRSEIGAGLGVGGATLGTAALLIAGHGLYQEFISESI